MPRANRSNHQSNSRRAPVPTTAPSPHIKDFFADNIWIAFLVCQQFSFLNEFDKVSPLAKVAQPVIFVVFNIAVVVCAVLYFYKKDAASMAQVKYMFHSISGVNACLVALAEMVKLTNNGSFSAFDPPWFLFFSLTIPCIVQQLFEWDRELIALRAR